MTVAEDGVTGGATDAVEPAGWWRGRPDDPAWVRPGLVGLLAATAALYLWGLSANGWGNDFYAAAVQAGTTSWKAFLYGSSDGGNSITVDKPPLSLWPMVLSARVFGLGAWSILVPQALMGVATVGVVYLAVRRAFRAGAGLLAGLVVALTPAAALMFRFDNPDALLTLLMAVAAYGALRAVEDGRWRWYVLCGAAVGLGFLTKQLQVLLVVPGFALAGIVAAPGDLWRRLRGLLAAGAALVVTGGWWVALVELVPESSRPYIGGSTNNSFLDLTFGYNGLGRLSGDESGGLGGPTGYQGGGPGGLPGGGGSPFSASRGALRMFGDVVGGQIAWLLPAAVVGALVVLWVTRHAPRTDRRRAAVLVWGAWLGTTAFVFSFMNGIFHEYYVVALAPAVGALVGMGAGELWARRGSWRAMAVAAVTVAGSVWWASVLLGRAPDWNPWLTAVVVGLGVVGTAGFVWLAASDRVGTPRTASAAGVVAGVSLAAVLVGPAAWSVETAANPRTGPIVTAGPAVAGAGLFGGAGGAVPPGQLAELADQFAGQFPGGQVSGGQGGAPQVGGQDGAPALGGAFPPGFTPPGGTLPGGLDPSDLADLQPGDTVPGLPGVTVPDLPGGLPSLPGAGAGLGGGPGGGFAGADLPDDEVVTALAQDADASTWVAATVSSNSAARFQLAVRRPVMPIGGFSGGDPSPTLEQFQQYVADGRIHWFLSGGGPGGGPGGAPGGAGTAADITEWVADHFEPTTIGGVTMYDLTAPPSS